MTVIWDPARPHRCAEFQIDDDDRVNGVRRAPWLRLAGIIVLDRWLYLALDRALLDAETAAAQFAAARTLRATEPAREFLITRALIGARRASPGVAAYLKRFVAEDRQPPPTLAAPLSTLAHTYAALSAEVRGFDAELAAVTKMWRRLAAVERAAPPESGSIAPPASTEHTPAGAAQIDPRTVPARVLRLGPTIDAAEVSLDPLQGEGRNAVRVRVDAFSTEPSLGERAEVGVRLIDRRSGQISGYGRLGRPSRGRHFEVDVPLPDATAVPDVRADVFGVAGAREAAPAGRLELRRVRRATLFLAGWRALVADVRLRGSQAAPASRLRAIVEQIADKGSEPLWSGGPTRSDLSSLIELGDRTLTARLRARSDPVADGSGADAIVAAVSGPGDLLVAEIAAAYDRSRAV